MGRTSPTGTLMTFHHQPNPFQKLYTRFVASRLGAALHAPLAIHLDRAAFRLTGGRRSAASLLSGLPIAQVTMTGARTGRPREVPLVAVPDGPDLIVVASNWGRPKHPAWYYNLRAYPDVTVLMNGVERPFTAHLLDGAARADAWTSAVAVYPGYAGYAARAGREIPLFRLTPAEADA